MPGEAGQVCEEPTGLLESLKKSAAALRRAGIGFALAGGFAAYARGAALPTHDVDFVVLEEDAGAAASALADVGMRIVWPPEDWLVKAYDGPVMVDLIYCIAGEPVTSQMIDTADRLQVAAMQVPVLAATDLVMAWLRVLTEHHADFAALLALVRPLREQVDWPRVRKQAVDLPFAEAFLFLLERLRVAPPTAESGP